MRLAGRIAEGGGAAGRHRGHQRVFGGRDARLVQKDVGAGEPLGLDLVGGADRHRGAELLQGQEVRVDAAPPDDVAPRWGQAHAPEAGEHRAREQDGGADARAQRGIELARLGPSGVHVHAVRSRPGDGRAEVREQLQHRLHVANMRHVVEAAGPVGEQGGGEDGEGRVLVARRTDGAFERATARDREGRRHGEASYAAFCAAVKRAARAFGG